MNSLRGSHDTVLDPSFSRKVMQVEKLKQKTNTSAPQVILHILSIRAFTACLPQLLLSGWGTGPPDTLGEHGVTRQR